ncbi:MAG TPA: putative zinc-binding protein, partial [Dongiaceae bacterium]|nr:putative zinc-binding protein [Dongiaceae bacterium]
MNKSTPSPASRRVVIYACSGGSDAGELADRTARALAQQHWGEMSCLAGIGGRVKPLLNRAEQAAEIVVIDGCPLNCARHTLALAGFPRVQ